jgi:hypothetical protein
VHEVKSGKMDKAFASAWYGFMNSQRGPGVLRHIFLNISTAGFNPYADAPMTDEKRAMTEASRTDGEAVVKQAFDDKTGPFEKDGDHVFPWKGKPVDDCNGHAFKEAVERAGVGPLRCMTCATRSPPGRCRTA